jgi:hypothetical protein
MHIKLFRVIPHTIGQGAKPILPMSTAHLSSSPEVQCPSAQRPGGLQVPLAQPLFPSPRPSSQSLPLQRKRHDRTSGAVWNPCKWKRYNCWLVQLIYHSSIISSGFVTPLRVTEYASLNIGYSGAQSLTVTSLLAHSFRRDLDRILQDCCTLKTYRQICKVALASRTCILYRIHNLWSLGQLLGPLTGGSKTATQFRFAWCCGEDQCTTTQYCKTKTFLKNMIHHNPKSIFLSSSVSYNFIK